jgi:hypothetical protein
MNAHNQSHSVAGPSTDRRLTKPRKSRSKFAYLFDLTDAKESRVCAAMSVFHLGKTYEAVKLKRTYRAIGGQTNRAIFEIVKMRRRPIGERWGVVGWDIDLPEYSFLTVPTKRFALAMLREFPRR